MNKKVSQFIPVENFINPLDQNIWWYYIPGFNGYEISNTGIVRSMKHYRKYKFGILIRPKEVTNPMELFTNTYSELTYELSDNNNERQVIKRSELQYLASTNPYHVQGYPRRTIITDIASRNQRIFIQKKCKVDKSSLKDIHKVQLYYEQDTDNKIRSGELINMEKEQPHIIQAISFERTDDSNG